MRIEGSLALPQYITLARFAVCGQINVGDDHVDARRSQLPPGFLRLLHRGGGAARNRDGYACGLPPLGSGKKHGRADRHGETIPILDCKT